MKAILLPALRILFFLMMLWPLVARAETPLTLNSYLDQVKKKNGSVVGSLESEKAAKERGAEGQLILSPTLFANVTLASDAKLPQIPFYSYDNITTDVYQLGISQLTTFGMQAKLSYELDYTSFQNFQVPGQSVSGIPLSFYDAAPRLELTQSLWSNGFGRSTQAAVELAQAQHEANQYGARFQARSFLAQAEAAYWRLAVARDALTIAEKTLEQARKLHEWTSRRAKMNLGENADDLQAEANYELRQLDLKSAKDEERSACRAFNMMRNLRSDQVADTLAPLDTELLQSIGAPKRSEMRDDVEAAKRQSKAAQAASTIAEEKDKPSLDVFGSYALNGRDVGIDSTVGNSYWASRPTKSIGIKLTMPLDFGIASESRHGAARERNATETVFEQKVLDQEQSWEDLTRKLDEAKQRLTLSTTIEQAQQVKLTNERQRLTNGRTTTYQVLLFEGDYAQAELTRLRAQAEILSLITQMKLYSAEDL